MRVRETHKNGAAIEISGFFRVDKVLNTWRDRQDGIEPTPDPEASRPKMAGTSSAISGPVGRDHEHSARGLSMPVVNSKFGFQPNE